MTECKQVFFEFQGLGRRKVTADFSGGRLSSEGGALLLRQVDEGLGVSERLAECFIDLREPELIEHSVKELVSQRLTALALGYEDLNDHGELRRDPLLAAVVGKSDVLGEQRRCEKDRGFALASPATLNRLELGAQFTDRYRKITPREGKVALALLELGVRCLPKESELIVLDFDATDDPLHGRQEGRFFHGYYAEYCYLPLYCFCGEVCLWAQLRTSDRDASEGTREALEVIVAAIRRRLPQATIVVRGDSAFAREELMAWCEAQRDIYYVVGLARNSRLEALLEPALMAARQKHCLIGGAASRVFKELLYQTRSTWSRARRVIAKAEVTAQGDNPRFIVTNIPEQGILKAEGLLLLEGRAETLYEDFYCARGNAENQIKQMTLDLKAGRTSTHWMASNQMRLWFSAFAYMLLERLRAWGLRGTVLARANLGTLRLRLLKVAASVIVSVRRIHVRLASAFPLKEVFLACQRTLARRVESS